MRGELALLRSRLAVCGASTDVPAMLSAAWEAFEYLARWRPARSSPRL
jgi:hypothetical protein